MAAKQDKKPFHIQVAENLIEQLEAGTSPFQKPWQAGEGHGIFPMNPTTGKRYRGINAIHLMAQGYGDNRWMTFKQANAAGASVKKGEKGTPIQYWKFHDERDKLDEQGRPVLDGKGQPVREYLKLERPRVFMAVVFNAQQIEGLPELAPPKPLEWSPVERADRILKASGADIRNVNGDAAFYSPSRDFIQLPLPSQFKESAGYYAVAMHELGHWTGHESRLDRDLAHPFGSEGYAKEELRAEIASMILGQEIGLGRDPGQHAAYVKSWIKVLKDDPMEIFRAAAEAEKIQDYVLELEQKLIQEETQSLDQSSKNDIEAMHRRLVQHQPAEALPGAVQADMQAHAAMDDAAKVAALQIIAAQARMRPEYREALALADAGLADQVDRYNAALEATDPVGYQALRQIEALRLADDLAVMTGEQIAQRASIDVETFQVINSDPVAAEALRWIEANGADSQVYADAVRDQLRAAQAIEPTTKAVMNDEATTREALAVAITAVTRDGNYNFDHFNAFTGARGEDATTVLEDALRDRGLARVVDVTGTDPATFHERAQEALRPIFSETHEGYLEHKGLSQAFALTAEQLVEQQRAVASLTPEQRQAQIQEQLAAMGYRMEPSLSALDGDEGHALIDIETGELVDPPNDTVLRLASEWSRLQGVTDDHSADIERSTDEQMQAQPSASEETEAWFLEMLQGDMAEDFPRLTARATIEQMEAAQTVMRAMIPLVQENPFWQRHQLPADTEDFLTRMGQADSAIYSARANALTNAELEVSKALRSVRAGGDSLRLSEAVGLLNVAGDLPTREPVSLPSDWTGQTTIAGLAFNGRGQSVIAADEGLEPVEYGVFARRDPYSDAGRPSNDWHHVGTTKTEDEAERLAERLALINAYAQPNELEQAAKLARVNEDRLRRDPAAADEDISAAKEARKRAEDVAMGAGQDLQARAAEDQRKAREASQRPAPTDARSSQDRQFIAVPFKEKDQAKALGAKWDRQAQSWYIPPNTDPTPFARWSSQGEKTAQAAPESAAQGQGPAAPVSTPQAPDTGRQYLAVPYGERQLAKAAGAKWDAAAKSWYAPEGANMGQFARWAPENVKAEQAPAQDPRAEFREAMEAMGLVCAGDHPIMDGKRHRVPVIDDKKGEKTGMYVGHLDGHPAGYIQNNRSGLSIKWKSKGYTLDPEQRALLQAEAAQKLQARAAEQDRTHAEVAQRVQSQMKYLVPIDAPTPYMQAKGITSAEGILTDREGVKTYIPVYDVDGKQWATQYIQEDGTKRFPKDAKKEGCFHVVGGLDKLAEAPAIVIGEGYATAWTLSAAVGHATVAAFDSGNLKAVAQILHERHPEKAIVIAGDDDLAVERQYGRNPGKAFAKEAAEAVGGKAVFPIFAPGEQQENPKAFTDFNDVATKSTLGFDRVKGQVAPVIEQAIREKANTLSNEQSQSKAQAETQAQTKEPRRRAVSH